MKEWDILAELSLRIKQDKDEVWTRIKQYYQEIGQSSYLDELDSVDGLTEFYASDSEVLND